MVSIPEISKRKGRYGRTGLGIEQQHMTYVVWGGIANLDTLEGDCSLGPDF